MWISKRRWNAMKERIAILEKEQLNITKYVNDSMTSNEEFIASSDEERANEIKRLIIKNGEFAGFHVGGIYARFTKMRKAQKYYAIAIILLQITTLLTVLSIVL